MGLAGSRVADQAQRVTAADPVAGGEGVDGGRVDVRVGLEVEVSEPLVPREPGRFDSAERGAAVPVVTFREEQLDEEPLALIHRRCGSGKRVGGSRLSLNPPTLTRW